MEPLPALTPLAPHLTRSHQPDESLEIVVRKIRAHFPETPGDFFADFLLTQSMNLGHAGFAVDVLACIQNVGRC
jgi:hypothetical protein